MRMRCRVYSRWATTPWFVALAAVLAPRAAWAHGGGHIDEELVWDLATAAVLVLAALGYAVGLARLHHRGAATSPRHAAAYFVGLAIVALALLSPIDSVSEVRFSAHMGQHELLVLFAAPLVVVGRPELVLRAALPVRARGLLGASLHMPVMTSMLRIATNRWLAVALHGIVVWLWHIPALFEAALHSETVHVLQHLSFFATAALFWWAMVRGRYGQLGYGIAVVFVFITALHKGLLAMLFTLSGRTIYPTHVERTRAAGHDPLLDQELAGVLMWVPAGVITAAIAIALMVAWLGALERRAQHADRTRRMS
jgi:putative membrane protein